MTDLIIWCIGAIIVRVWAKTHERNAAAKLTRMIYEGNNTDAVSLVGNLVARPTPAREFRRQLVGSLGAFLFFLFAYSLARVDARTPNSFVLWDNEKDFHNLRDADIYRAYMDWRMTYLFDWGSAILLILSLGALAFSFVVS